MSVTNSVGPGSRRTFRFVTLGASKVTERHACVGALTPDGSWVRPETPLLSDVRSPYSVYSYFQWATAELGSSLEPDPRPEDHHLLHEPVAEDRIPEVDWFEFLNRHSDRGAQEAFAGLRSLGLIKAKVRRIYMKQSTGGRSFLRCEFVDGRGDAYDWIISEWKFPELTAPFVQNHELQPETAVRLNAFLAEAETFFTVALTKPNNRFPGKFRGCQPVIIGFHSIPDYVPLLEQLGESQREALQEILP